MISTATIRSTNAKETKEKRNRERLLAGPAGSEFSIVAPDSDLEMDYYDYNVVNAGAAPGSYLGMDPAFLVWIPPLDEDGEILPNDGGEGHEMEDIRPKVYIDPGSNKESPEEEMLLPKATQEHHQAVGESTPKCSPIVRHKKVHPFICNEQNKEKFAKEELEGLIGRVTLPMHEFPRGKVERQEMEKETKVEKSPSVEEIRFADDDDEVEDGDKEWTDNQCNIDLSYQDSNILSSS